MNKLEYDNAKAELAVLEQDYSDMGRIMELRNKLSSYKEEQDPMSATYKKRQDSTKSKEYNDANAELTVLKQDYNDMERISELEGWLANYEEEKDSNSAVSKRKADAEKSIVEKSFLPKLLNPTENNDALNPFIYAKEKDINLENGENWFTTDSLENVNKEIDEWSKIKTAGAQEVAKTLIQRRDDYKKRLEEKGTLKRFSQLPEGSNYTPYPTLETMATGIIDGFPMPAYRRHAAYAATKMQANLAQNNAPKTAITAEDAALMADHLYGYKDFPSDYLTSDYLEKRKVGDGWRLIDTVEGSEGMVMGVYVRGDGEHSSYKGPKEYAFVNKGTETGTEWKNNFQQPVGASTDMKESIGLAKYFNDGDWGNYGMTFVGHSKGGAEATANAVATGRNAVTFNTAGAVLAPYGLNKFNNNSEISNYVVKGEPLSLVNNYTGIYPMGKEYKLPFYSFDPIKQHSMEAIIKGLKGGKA